ncbi:MAG: YD repeat-containing protein [Saprospiraceae bacterium]|jgi:YD repeat-containing protein
MRKSLLFSGILISLLFLWSNCQSDKDTAATKDETSTGKNANSNKKQVHFKEQWVSAPPDFDTLLLSYVEEYDKRGNLIEKKEYNAQGELVIHTKKTYNEYNDEIQKTAENFQAKNFVESSNEIDYANGKKTTLVSRSKTGTIESIYIYFENGDYKWSMIKDGEETEYILYNKNGLKIETSRMNGQMTQKFKYDDHGTVTLRIRKATIHPEEVLAYINEYDSEGNLTRKSYGNRIEDYTYNEDGNVKTETWYFVDEKIQYMEYKYQYY